MRYLSLLLPLLSLLPCPSNPPSESEILFRGKILSLRTEKIVPGDRIAEIQFVSHYRSTAGAAYPRRGRLMVAVNRALADYLEVTIVD